MPSCVLTTVKHGGVFVVRGKCRTQVVPVYIVCPDTKRGLGSGNRIRMRICTYGSCTSTYSYSMRLQSHRRQESRIVKAKKLAKNAELLSFEKRVSLGNGRLI